MMVDGTVKGLVQTLRMSGGAKVDAVGVCSSKRYRMLSDPSVKSGSGSGSASGSGSLASDGRAAFCSDSRYLDGQFQPASLPALSGQTFVILRLCR